MLLYGSHAAAETKYRRLPAARGIEATATDTANNRSHHSNRSAKPIRGDLTSPWKTERRSSHRILCASAGRFDSQLADNRLKRPEK